MVFGQLHQTIRQAYRKSFGQDPLAFEITAAPSPFFGDFSTNLAMVSAAKDGGSAVALAQQIVAALEQTGVFRSVSVSTPGFINFTITDQYLQGVVETIIDKPEAFGRSDLGKEIRVLVEYISANPTGPLTLANGRGAFIGETIARVLELYGCKVVREFYLNDRGSQITALGHSVLKDDQAEYRGPYIDQLATRIKATDPVEVGEQAARTIFEEMIKPCIREMGIEFHQFFSEKSLHQTGVFKKVMEMLEQRGLTYMADGAKWLSTTRFGDDKDRVLVRSDGQDSYFASDIAYHAYKLQRGYHRLINVVGADHYTYTKQLTMVVEGVLRGQYTWGGKLDWVITQLVKLVRDGQEIKMSKRTGSYVPLDELVAEVGPDAARFYYLHKSADSHLNFDLNLARSSSNQNPIFYVQYAYARVSSILRQATKENGEETIAPSRLMIRHPLERALLLKIIQFPDLVEEIAGDLQVHKLTHYVICLAGDLHSFYEKLRVIGESPETSQTRLTILKATSLTIKKALDLIGISAPSRMLRDQPTGQGQSKTPRAAKK